MTLTAPPPLRAAPPAQSRFLVRKIQMQVTINGIPVPDVMWIRVRFGFAEPVASAQFMCPVRNGDYNQEVQISCGATPGKGLLLRFKGRLRNPSGEYWPRAVTHNVVGELSHAAEYYNTHALAGFGGMWLPELFARAQSAPGEGIPWIASDLSATADAIVDAVLTTSGTPHARADIHGTTVLYGQNNAAEFMWQAGTPRAGEPLGISGLSPGEAILSPTQAGETALAYIQRYDQIDAEWSGDVANWSGGFYRTSEGLGGRVYRVRIGGRPYSPWNFAFVESGPGANILQGSRIERQFPTGNRIIVTGMDYGTGAGPMRFSYESNNPYMPQDQAFYAPSPPSSSMIEWATDAMAATAGHGQSCQTIAMAALLEANRETPSGEIITAEDDGFTQGISVLVAGTYDASTTASTPGRLMSNEPFWVQGVTLDCGYGSDGEPNFIHTLEVQGGGTDSAAAPPPDWSP